MPGFNCIVVDTKPLVFNGPKFGELRVKPRDVLRMVAAYQIWAHSICAPIFWEDGEGQTYNGSLTLLKTDERLLGITNSHVARGLADCTEEVGHRCQIGGAYLDPKRLISEHPTMDIATFELSDVLMGQVSILSDASIGAGIVHQGASVSSWPIPSPGENDPVMYGGYPGAYRAKLENGNVNFGFFWFATKVQSVSEKNIGMVIDPTNSISVGKVKLDTGADLGGWSGGPVFRIVEHERIERLELCGIIYEYSAQTGIVLSHPLTDLNPDGTFG